jgi:transcription elongation factor
MRFASIAALSALIFTSSLALAQNAATGSATPSGDSAVSPATVNPAGSTGVDRSSLGAGVNSGAMNNGTTGDTIGTGSGTSSGPSTGQATHPVPDRR